MGDPMRSQVIWQQIETMPTVYHEEILHYLQIWTRYFEQKKRTHVRVQAQSGIPLQKLYILNIFSSYLPFRKF